ncbi:LAQU0S10e02322g1_1 [Lachancea quebecensis]|uniref:Exosome complex protein n=1 Tax=Lachancea quebecensis TaxID=1654605 RepID=A0A0P1KTX9_9SACH|nr:LAQU0S10e02322g1_1 [Lachancea quebecensis]
MDDSSKIKPYIAHLDGQLKKLAKGVELFTSKSLDEQLLEMKTEREKLDLTNRYAYVLSSLLFAYMKLLDVKDLAPIKQELDRVKRYMNLAKQLDQKNEGETLHRKEEQERAKKLINSALDGRTSGPAISKVNFEGKHTRFKDHLVDSPEDRGKLSQELQKQVLESKRSKTNKPKGGVSKKGKK